MNFNKQGKKVLIKPFSLLRNFHTIYLIRNTQRYKTFTSKIEIQKIILLILTKGIKILIKINDYMFDMGDFNIIRLLYG